MDGLVTNHFGETLSRLFVVLGQNNFAGGCGNNGFQIVFAVFSGDLPQILSDQQVGYFLSASDCRAVDDGFQFGHLRKLVENEQSWEGSHLSVGFVLEFRRIGNQVR